jgi:hypothetical protein
MGIGQGLMRVLRVQLAPRMQSSNPNEWLMTKTFYENNTNASKILHVEEFMQYKRVELWL